MSRRVTERIKQREEALAARATPKPTPEDVTDTPKPKKPAPKKSK